MKSNQNAFIQDDLKWLSVEYSAIFHDSYVGEVFESLPPFEGTEPAEEEAKKDEDGTGEVSSSQPISIVFPWNISNIQ